MAILDILHHPDSRLLKKSCPIDIINDDIKTLAKNMLETMYDAPGIGLAAPQINQQIRLIVVDVSEEKNQPLILINPIITEKHDQQIGQEGCLSIPGITADIERAERITVTYQNLDNQKIILEATDLLSVCIQHEIDHLDGKLFVDYLSRLKQQRILKKIQKQKMANG